MQEEKTPMPIIIPDFCLILLVGCSGSGKSTFARRLFKETEIISSDQCRALVSDDENNQAVSGDAFDLLHKMVCLRLKNRRLTVVDATNLQQSERQSLRLIAKSYHAAPFVIVINPGVQVCLAQNGRRLERIVPEKILQEQNIALKRSLQALSQEAFSDIFDLNSVAMINDAQIVRSPLKVDQRHICGNFDIIGDVHGCFDELVLLLKKLGYAVTRVKEGETDGAKGAYQITVPKGRRVIFLGDLVDRGPKTPEVLELVKFMVDAGLAFCVEGNHEAKLLRWLKGKKVNPKYGLAESIEQLSQRPAAFHDEMMTFIKELPSHLWLDKGKLLVAHAGLKEEMHGKMSGKEKSFCLYGDTTGEKNEFGWPIRLNWGADYTGEAMIVYGHTPVKIPEWQNNTLCIDTGCAFGGALTALRYPEKEIISMPALKTYMSLKKPLGRIFDEGEH